MSAATTVSLEGATRLSDWGVIRAAGPDAATFLHAQLTQDIEHLESGRAALAGYCSAKGRLLASFVVWTSSPDELLLACSADLLAPTLKRLSMFVLRAKCTLADASAELPLWGVAGEAARTEALQLPGAQGVARALRVGEPPALPRLDASAWAWLEVRSAVPRIVAATVEQFVPQTVNFELVGGVNFKKGCFPGQEVVARSQYRGTLKRRAFVFECAVAARPGQELFHSADPSQPAGRIANAASLDDRHAVLAEVKLAALDAGSLHLGAPDGPALVRAAMPYDVPLRSRRLSARFYVYYRVRGDAVDEVVACVRTLHQRWQAQLPSLHCELLRRDDDPGANFTLMEVLSGATTEQHAAFEAEAARALAPWLDGDRHVERFRPCA